MQARPSPPWGNVTPRMPEVGNRQRTPRKVQISNRTSDRVAPRSTIDHQFTGMLASLIRSPKGPAKAAILLSESLVLTMLIGVPPAEHCEKQS